MTLEEKYNELSEFCDNNSSCSTCLVSRKFPAHSCGGGYTYEYEDEARVPAEEVEKIYSWLERYEINEQEGINHPSRYAGGKFECIEVMADVFGKEAVKDFCLLNAFKYIWRQEKKGGVEDVKKAVWYLNKYIELSDSHENV